ncbi:unnamed protein product [Soboliphyme baturini]|uniref:Uncharacterized protein n=1 Tax=Soboliphyme baturini TaxID=241478 RepID=A0A183IX68_9BILA|nr:unnamed protein product [Soboliphyme baturini]
MSPLPPDTGYQIVVHKGTKRCEPMLVTGQAIQPLVIYAFPRQPPITIGHPMREGSLFALKVSGRSEQHRFVEAQRTSLTRKHTALFASTEAMDANAEIDTLPLLPPPVPSPSIRSDNKSKAAANQVSTARPDDIA